MYKIISILFVITLINAAPAAEYTPATAKVWKDAATADLATANGAKSTAAGLTATQQAATTSAVAAQKAALEAYTAAVATLATSNQNNLAAAALAGAAKAKYAGLLATTNLANTANQLNIANVAATAARTAAMVIPSATTTTYAAQAKALADAVQVTGNTGLVGLAAGTLAGYGAVGTYVSGLITTQTADSTGIKKSTATSTASTYASAQLPAATGATSGGTKCLPAKATALENAANAAVTAQIAYQTATGLLANTQAVLTEWTSKMGAAGATNKMTMVGAAVTKVKTELAPYTAASVAQTKVVTDQQAVVAGLVTLYAGKAAAALGAYNDAKALSDADNTVNTNAKNAATAALSAYTAAVLSVTNTRATRDSTATAAMTANGVLAGLQVTEAATVGQVNYETANLALANAVVAEVGARATMRANLVSAATAAATAAASAAEAAATAAASAAAAAVTQAQTQLATDTAAAVKAKGVAQHKLDLVQMTKWNESYALDALIAKKICDAAVADASKKTL